MQTICAHCYTFLNRRQQRLACILCRRCEQNWLTGKTPQPDRPLPEWPGNPGLLYESISASTRA